MNTHLTLTPEESEFLAELLTSRLKETRVEAHRTDSPIFREHVTHREHLIEELLHKLGEPAHAAGFTD